MSMEPGRTCTKVTNIQVIQQALRRVGLNETSTTFKNAARDYLNIITKEVSSRAKWFWMFKASTFTVTSGTQTYSLASDVAEPLSFRNKTEDHVMLIISSQALDASDPDHSITGDTSYVVIDGINSSTGYVQVALYPKPTNSTDVIAYRYYAFIPDFDSDDDADSLDVYMPPIIQPALIFGISALYKEEKGDDQGAITDRREMERVIQRGLMQNTHIQGNRSYRRRRSDDGHSYESAFAVEEGSLS